MTTPRTRPPRLHTLLDFTALAPGRALTPRALATLLPTLPPNPHAAEASPVLVIPGIFHSDDQTIRFRNALDGLRYTPFGWELGGNWGPNRHTMEGISRRLTTLARDHGPVRIIGFSLGGLFARWLAQSRPHSVAQVITICAPFNDPLTSAWLPTGLITRNWKDVDVGALVHMVRARPPMPWGAIYSPIDGIVASQSCMDAGAPENCIAVRVRHRYAMNETSVLAAAATMLAGV